MDSKKQSLPASSTHLSVSTEMEWQRLDERIMAGAAWPDIQSLARSMPEYFPGEEALTRLNEKLISSIQDILLDPLRDRQHIKTLLLEHPYGAESLTKAWDGAKKRTPLHYLLNAGAVGLARDYRPLRRQYQEYPWLVDIASIPFKSGKDLYAALSFLIGAGASVDARSKESGILSAIVNGWKNHGFSTHDLNRLIDLVKSEANTRIMDQYGLYPWMLALRSGCPQPTFEKLLEGFTPEELNTPDKRGWTACHHAAQVRRPDLIRVLHAHGCRWPETGPNPVDLANEINWPGFRQAWFACGEKRERTSSGLNRNSGEETKRECAKSVSQYSLF